MATKLNESSALRTKAQLLALQAKSDFSSKNDKNL